MLFSLFVFVFFFFGEERMPLPLVRSKVPMSATLCQNRGGTTSTGGQSRPGMSINLGITSSTRSSKFVLGTRARHEKYGMVGMTRRWQWFVRASSNNDEGLGEENNNSEDTSTEGGDDWRSFRAQLIQSYNKTETSEEGDNKATREDKVQEGVVTDSDKSDLPERLWAHDIGNRPEKGCLIIARPDAFLQSQRYFHEAVIFLVDYSPSKGAVGLILNRPTQFTLNAISFDITSPEDDEGEANEGGDTGAVNIPEFLRENRVYFGGDVKSASSTLMAMHPFDETIIPGAQKVVEGVYCNGKWFELNGDNGPAVALDAPKYKFFAQYAGWAPGQLERELDTNDVWIAAACAPELVLKQVIQLPKPLWREVLELMGGEYAIMSKQQYGEL